MIFKHQVEIFRSETQGFLTHLEDLLETDLSLGIRFERVLPVFFGQGGQEVAKVAQSSEQDSFATGGSPNLDGDGFGKDFAPQGGSGQFCTGLVFLGLTASPPRQLD